jgi:hypothetical protein
MLVKMSYCSLNTMISFMKVPYPVVVNTGANSVQSIAGEYFAFIHWLTSLMSYLNSLSDQCASILKGT